MRKRILSIMLAMMMGVSVSTIGMNTNTIYASVKTPIIKNTVSENKDLYALQESEIVNFDGVSYVYEYFYENGNRTTRITDEQNNQIALVSYDEDTGNIYLNNQQIGVVNLNNDIELYNASDWELLSSSSDVVSWAIGTTVGIVASVISTVIGIKTSKVKLAMGVDVLGQLASSTTGGTLSVQLYKFKYSANYRYTWSFKASTGDLYGPYYYLYTGGIQ